MPRVLLVLLTALILPVSAADELCGTSAKNDAIVRAIHERPRDRARVTSQAAPAAVVREGAVYLQADEESVPGYHPFDLAGKSVVYEPRSATTFRVHHESLQYVEPNGAMVRDFETDITPLAHDLPFTLNLFGRSVSRIYVTAFNSIQLDEPGAPEGALQVDVVEGATHAQAVISPLLITNRKPRFLLYPQVFVEDTADAVRVTWRSMGGDPFRYDIQAAIHTNGSIVFSYKDVQAMSWGAPVVSPGMDSALVTRDLLDSVTDRANDVVLSFGANIKDMLDIRKAELFRINGTDLFSVRLTLGAPVNPALLSEGQSLLYRVSLADEAEIEIDRNGNATITPFGSFRSANGGSVRVSGDTIEFFGRQSGTGLRTLTVETWIPPLQRYVDAATVTVSLDAPPRASESDLSTLATPADVPLPVVEAFTLAPLDPLAVYQRLREQFGLNTAAYDSVAIYQTFYTDLIFYAGAYSTGGNPRVDGIGTASSAGSRFGRAPSLLHLNQLTYNYSSAEQTASKVMLHEFGHRWLYFVSIKENGIPSRVLNPVSPHPAAYVHTASAFPVYGQDESSVMGGAYFTDEGGGSYRARAANMGYSWTDLYLMGVAAREEVPDWFYLANTNPPLPNEYWPADGAVVSGEKHSVSLQQVIDVHGVRSPSPATSQRRFNIVFVLLTEPGVDATDEQVARLNERRALLERNFSIATGGRASVRTTFAIPSKTRATR